MCLHTLNKHESYRLAALTTDDLSIRIARATIHGERRVTIGAESSRKFSRRIARPAFQRRPVALEAGQKDANSTNYFHLLGPGRQDR